MNPPVTDPPSMATPVVTWPLAKTDSRSPSKPLWSRASTSQASTAPEKNVKPSPMVTEATAQPQKGASICHMRR